MERKTFEIEVIDGRQFIIKKMPAAESMSVLKEILTRSLPIDLLSLINVEGKSIGSTLSSSGLGQGSQMSIDEFSKFQMRLMKNVSERLPGGDIEVVDSLGNFKVEDLEFNLDLFLTLLLKVVSVNYKDFFIEKMKKLGFLDKVDNIQDEELKNLAKTFLE